MLFENEARKPLKISVKPSILELAKSLYKKAYPFSSKANIDDLFEELVSRAAHDAGLVNLSEEKPIPVEYTNDYKDDTLDSILR